MDWLWLVLGGALGVLALILKGESQGKTKAEHKQQAEVLDRVEQAKKVSDDVRSTDADERRNRLRDYTDK